MEGEELRLDAGHFNPAFIRALDTLSSSGMQIVRLGSLVSRVFMPPRFRRIYVGKSEGLPFLQGSHVVHFRPADVKYLSPNSVRKMEDLIVKSGWLLVTRSGTVGRVTICPREWNAWAATEDVIRIVPDEDKCPSGYLYSFLASQIGQIQLTTQIHGAVIDHLTEQNVRDVLVPMPATKEDHEIMDSIDLEAKTAVGLRSEAVASTENAIDGIGAAAYRGGRGKVFGQENGIHGQLQGSHARAGDQGGIELPPQAQTVKCNEQSA